MLRFSALPRPDIFWPGFFIAMPRPSAAKTGEKMKNFWMLAVMGAAFSSAAGAQETQNTEEAVEETVEITSTRLPREVSQSPSAVTVITRRQIEAQKPFDLAEILNRAPGVSISRSGSPGQTTTVRLRGAESDHTLVLLDGVRLNSPSTGLFDFGQLLAENVERIEILRGPQSGLYGSEALGGVVNIITRRGSGPFATGGLLEYGTQNTNKQVITAGGELKKGRLSFSATRLHSDGFGANDDYKNLGASLRYDLSTSQSGTLSFITRLEDAKSGAPNQRALSFDPNARAASRNWTNSIQWRNETERRHDKIVLGLFDRKFRYDDPVNAPGGSFQNNRFDDQNAQLEAQTSLIRGAHTLTLGGDYRREKADLSFNSGGPFGPFAANFSPKRNNWALFAQDEFRREKFTLIPSIRYENNEQFGSDFNGRLAGSYQLGKGRVKASIGTGFRAPTFNELYFPNFGNPNLQPEQSTGADLGFERPTKNGGRFEANVFYNRFRDLIGSDPVTFLPVNLDRATAKGIELYLSQPVAQNWTVILNQTVQSVDSANQTYILRRPRYATALDVLYKKEKWNADLSLISQGRRFDDNFLFGAGARRGYYPGFTRLDLTVGYDLRPNLEVYARAGNLLNRRYEEVAGFPAPRFNIVFGIRAKAF
ncbi:MAG TPA: TonB-dependent receptor [Abditibacteriaceae bacterium]